MTRAQRDDTASGITARTRFLWTSFITGCPRDWTELPRPDRPLIVGYVHFSTQRSRRDGWFEVIADKMLPADGPAHVLRIRADLRSCWLIRLGVDRRAGVAVASA
jgi:hypothetical protein